MSLSDDKNEGRTNGERFSSLSLSNLTCGQSPGFRKRILSGVRGVHPETKKVRMETHVRDERRRRAKKFSGKEMRRTPRKRSAVLTECKRKAG